MVAFTYDPNGNLSTLTPPGQPTHQFGYTLEDIVNVYTPPTVTSPPASPIGTQSTSYGYNLDGDLTGVTLPDSRTIVPTYDAFGRLDTVQTARTTVRMHYAADTGQLVSITDALASGTSPTGASVAITHDGALFTSASWSGAVTGSVSYAYNADLLVTTTTVPGTPAATNGYDTDLLLTSITIDGGTPGSLTLTRDSRNGLLTGTTLGSLATAQGYDTYGAMTSLTAKFGTTTLYSATLMPDGAGRIQEKIESVQGVSHSYVYAYDDADRLTDVTIDGVLAAHYTYDGNGNRLTGTALGAPGTALTGTYDAQDRLITYGSTSYVFGPNGDLQSKTAGGQTTAYTYDSLGALSRVTLPNGDRIDYLLDAVGRRVGTKLNGVFQRGWLYEGIRPIAELDGTGAVVARFIFGTRLNVPDLMWKGGALYRFLTDERGSVRLVLNVSTGAVVQRIDYDVWGNVVGDTAPGFQPFGFAGGLYDRDTKLTRFARRDYDAETGRWTDKDPLRFLGGLNLYTYAANDPVNKIDPQGTELILAVVGSVVGAGANALYAWQTGGDVVNAAVIGGVTGFVTGLIPSPWVAGAVFGAVSTALNRNFVNCENTLPWYVDVGVNAIAGGVGTKLGGVLGRASVLETLGASNAAGMLGEQLGGFNAGVWTTNVLQTFDLLDMLEN